MSQISGGASNMLIDHLQKYHPALYKALLPYLTKASTTPATGTTTTTMPMV
jgi:hypothetical protein